MVAEGARVGSEILGKLESCGWEQTMAQKGLEGKVALVTGGGSGIGLATAQRLVHEGCRVAILGRDGEELEQAARKIDPEGDRVMVLVADITDEKRMMEVIESLPSDWRPLDIVVANAGTNGVWAAFDKLKVADFRSAIDINLTGTFITLKAAHLHFNPNGGSIVIVSSINGTRVLTNSGATAYACSKAAQVTMSKMLALEFAKEKIRVNAVCPGAIDTPIHDKTVRRDLEEAQEPVEFPEGNIPLTDGQQGDPDQVASVIAFLASDDSSHITGTVVYVDGGQSLLQG
jgi:NAD(P)-dependent dehydrogenase (short-subunit alcohol dehydrogenase family)